MRKDAFVRRTLFKITPDPEDEKLVDYKVWVKLPCGKAFSIRRKDVLVAQWYMAGTWFSNAQNVLYGKIMKHRKKCKKCRKARIREWDDKHLVRV